MSAANSIQGPGRGRKRRRAGPDGQPGHCPDTRTGNSLPAGTHARRFTSSLVTVMIRKEGTYVRAMRVAPARQLMLDIAGADSGAGRDPGQIWAQLPDTARARVLHLLAAMIAAGVVIDGKRGAGAVRGDG